MFGFLTTLGIGFGLWVGHNAIRDYVARRLRFVDAIHKPYVPFVAGGVATALALPITTLLPVLSAGTAVGVGLAVGFGVLNGARAVRRYLPR